MARIEIVKKVPDADGVTVTFDAVSAAAAPDGNYWVTDGTETALIQNDSAAPITMTVDVAVAVDGVAAADRTVTVPANSIVAWRPKDVHRQVSGQVHVNWSTATDVGIAVLDR